MTIFKTKDSAAVALFTISDQRLKTLVLFLSIMFCENTTLLKNVRDIFYFYTIYEKIVYLNICQLRMELSDEKRIDVLSSVSNLGLELFGTENWAQDYIYHADLLINKAFFQYGLHRVYLNVLSNNTAAIKLYERCGFRFEGEFREHFVIDGAYVNLCWYGIIQDEFAEQLKV